MALPAFTTAHHGRTFYCPHCCCAVKSTNKTAHDSSELHRQSVLHDTMIKSLKLIYENKNNVSKVLDDIAELIKTREKDQFDERLKNNGTLNTPDISADANIKDEREEIHSNTPSGQDLLEFFKIVTVPNFNPTFQFAGEKFLHVQTPYGDVRLAVDNYHKLKSYLEEKMDINHCLVQKPAKKEEVAFCNVCKEHIANIKAVIDGHMNADEHEKNYMSMLRGNSMIKINDVVTFCSACSANMLEWHEIGHIGEEKHKNNVRDKSVTIDNSDSNSERASTSQESNDSKTKTSVTGSSEFINKSVLTKNYIAEFNRDLLYCDVCRVFVKKSLTLYHINKCDHKSNLTKRVKKTKSTVDLGTVKAGKEPLKPLNNLPKEIERTGKKVECKICKVKIPDTVANINDHLLGQRHVKAVNEKAEKEKAKNITFNNKNIKHGAGSDGTNQKVTATVSYAEMARLDKKNENELAGTNKEAVKNIQKGSDKVAKGKLHYVFTITDDLNKARCKVCSEEFDLADAVTPGFSETHRSSDAHKDAYSAKLESQTMCRVNKNCYCLCCNEIFTINLEYYHMNSTLHQFNLSTCPERLDKVCLSRVAMLKIMDAPSIRKRQRVRRKSKVAVATSDAINEQPTPRDVHETPKESAIIKSESLQYINSDLNSEISNRYDSSDDNHEIFQDTDTPDLSQTENYDTDIDEVLPENANVNSDDKHDANQNNNINNDYKENAVESNDAQLQVAANAIDEHDTANVEYIFLQNMSVENMEIGRTEQNCNYRVCEACGVDLLEANVAYHYEGTFHKTNEKLFLEKKLRAAVQQIVSSQSHEGDTKTDNVIVDGFCTICNVVTTDSIDDETHTNRKVHQNKLKNLFSERETVDKPKTIEKRYVCNICMSKGFSTADQLLHHMNDDNQHRKKVRRLAAKVGKSVEEAYFKTPVVCNTTESATSSEDTLASTSQPVLTETPTIDKGVIAPESTQFYWCEICEKKVPNTASCINDHVRGKNHKRCMEKTFASKPNNEEKTINTSAPKDENDTSYEHTNKTLSHDSSQTANVDKNSTQAADDFKYNINTNSQNHGDKPEVKDGLGNYTVVISSLTGDNEHANVQNRVHGNIYNNNNISGNLSEPVNDNNTQCGLTTMIHEKNIDGHDGNVSETSEYSDNNDTGFFVCKICLFAVPNDPVEIRTHLAGFRHNKNVDLLKENKEQVPNLNEIFDCDICGVKLHKNAMQISTHYKTNAHNRILQKVLLKNSIRMRDDRVCYCVPCDLYFTKNTVSTHIASKTHLISLFQFDQQIEK
ncbi:uncharacterized protein LOC126379362 isoform X2 [Pectinophora gossypiella]|nr:uncharacterized protein LOC126379362 isoform X2 [Pectinophora gossypiella]